VSLRSYDFAFDDLQYGTGIGARVRTPIGPLGVDLGFPLDAPRGDPIWQVHLSLGAPF
jgi:outer membrane translocation and assembly module TamA